MNEDDTFKKLRRTPFVEVFLYATQSKYIVIGEHVGERCKDYLKSAGWSHEEFLEEIVKREISLSVGDILDPKWREEFAKNTPIA